MVRHLVLIGAILMGGTAVVTVGSMGAGSRPAATGPAPATAADVMTFTGKLTTGMMAIGGETTGTIISDGKTSYELDIKDAALKTKANGLSGKQVAVTGKLTLKEGIEVGQRRIITVQTLEAAAPASEPAATQFYH